MQSVVAFIIIVGVIVGFGLYGYFEYKIHFSTKSRNGGDGPRK